MIVKRTYSELFRFDLVAGNYLKKNVTEENKICSSIKKMVKQLKTISDEFNDKRDDLQLNNCMVVLEGERKGAIIYNESTNANGEKTKERCFVPEGEIKLKADLKVLLNSEVEIHSRIPEGIEELILKLTDDEKELFSELVIPKQENLETE